MKIHNVTINKSTSSQKVILEHKYFIKEKFSNLLLKPTAVVGM